MEEYQELVLSGTYSNLVASQVFNPAIVVKVSSWDDEVLIYPRHPIIFSVKWYLNHFNPFPLGIQSPR